MTAVRRADATKSPMTKMMDLFRHRSNSAVSEADKRKAVSYHTRRRTHTHKTVWLSIQIINIQLIHAFLICLQKAASQHQQQIANQSKSSHRTNRFFSIFILIHWYYRRINATSIGRIGEAQGVIGKFAWLTTRWYIGSKLCCHIIQRLQRCK